MAGRLKLFVGAWMKITQDPKILDIVKGYKIPFHSKPFQSKIPSQPIASREKEELVKLEVKEMLKKRAIRKVQPSKTGFVNNLFLVKKKDGGQRPVINLKQLNYSYIPYCYFKMEGLQNVKYMLKKGDYMCKLDLKDAYFSVPLEKYSRQFFVSTGISTTKVPMTILRRIDIKIIIYLDHMLLIGHSVEEILISQDTVIFLLQHLGPFIKWKKSVLKPVQEIEFLGLTINSGTLELSLNKTKIEKGVSECQNLLNNPQTSILELTRLIG